MATSKFENENIRSLYNTPLAELQKRFLNEDPHDVFHYIYTGKVLSSSDPLKQGRLKIQVINFFDNLTSEEIPWAYPVQSIIQGSFSVPDVGDFLEVFFDHGDIYSPKYLGKAINTNQIPSHAKDSYPNTIVIYQTATGNYCTINKLTGEYKIVSQTGSIITMTSLGEIDVESKIKVNIKAPIVQIEHSGSSTVTPDPTGGPFCALPLDPVTGAVHQGQISINV